MADTAAQPVGFSALIAASWRAARAAWPAVLIVWAARAALEALVPMLRADYAWITAVEPWRTATPFIVGAALALVSGLMIRWLLAPRRESLRPDLKLAGYVGLLVASNLLNFAVNRAVLGAMRASADIGQAQTYATLAIGLSVVVDVIYAALALWPIAVLMGDKLGVGEAVRRMSGALLVWLVIVVVLGLPAFILSQVNILVLHHTHASLADRILAIGINALATTLSTVVLAQIYARRVRGEDLSSAKAR